MDLNPSDRTINPGSHHLRYCSHEAAVCGCVYMSYPRTLVHQPWLHLNFRLTKYVNQHAFDYAYSNGDK